MLAFVYIAAMVVGVWLLGRVSGPSDGSDDVSITYRAFGTTGGANQIVLLYAEGIVFRGESTLTPELERGVAHDVADGSPVRIDVAAPGAAGGVGVWACEIRGSDGEVIATNQVSATDMPSTASATCEATAA